MVVAAVFVVAGLAVPSGLAVPAAVETGEPPKIEHPCLPDVAESDLTAGEMYERMLAMLRCLAALLSGTMSADQVYEKVASSILAIHTDTGTVLGGGVLVEGGYVVTNYHVIHTNEKVSVTFPDGLSLEDVPVIAFDFIADIAVLGPVPLTVWIAGDERAAHDAPALELSNGEDLSRGSPPYLIGYPGEFDLFNKPTITAGVLSQVREWRPYDLTVLVTDASAQAGQSGGALVDGRGRVGGISSWTQNNLTYSPSGADVGPIVKELIENADGEPVSRKVITWGETIHDPDDLTELAGTDAHHGMIDYAGDTDLYVLEVERGDEVTVWVDAIIADTTLEVSGPDGEIVASSDDGHLPNMIFGDFLNPWLEFTAAEAGVYLIVVAEFDDQSHGGGYTLQTRVQSNHTE
ncbi:MAG: hypothetical protein F4X68_00205 [Acidimicrobiia bacterium]|nr:hypothetical protein [Acidimicrobiia bacterium]